MRTRHSHAPGGDRLRLSELRRYLYVFAISTAIFTLEIAVGIATNSLALIADAGHVLLDASAALIAIAVSLVVLRNPNAERTTRRIGFVVAIALLALIAARTAIEAVDRLVAPQVVFGAGVIPAALLGAYGNYLQHRVLVGGGENPTRRAMHLHVRADLAMSVGVACSGFVVILTSWHRVDAIVSLGIALWIAVQVIHLVRPPEHTH